MKSLDQKAAEYSASLHNEKFLYTKSDVETAYVNGVVANNCLSSGELGSFSQALNSIKGGYLVARSGWNGKGMFIFIRPADELHVKFVAKDIKSLPQKVKDYYAQDLAYEDDGKGVVAKRQNE